MPPRFFLLCLLALPLVAPRPDAFGEEPVPIFVANVDARPLADNPYLSLDSLTTAPNFYLAKLGKQIRELLATSPKVKLVESLDSTQPEGMLLLVMSLGDADVVRWGTDLEGGRKLTELHFRLSAELQLVEPISGQVVYADADYFLSEQWDEQARHYQAHDFDLKRVVGFKEDPKDSSTLHRYVGRKSTGSIGRQEAFQELMERGVAKMTRDLLTRFTPLRIRGQAARILSAAKGEFVLNRGRTAGLFEGMRLVSAKDNRVAKVTESFADYAIARMPSNPAPETWETFTAYQATHRSPQAQALTAVTCIIFSDTLLDQPEATFLREDEHRLNASLLGTNVHGPVAVPIFQAVFAKHLTDQLADGGKFRLGFPVSGKASLTFARINLKDKFTWNTNIYESSGLPDYGVTALVSNLVKSRWRIIGGHEDRYEVTVSLSLYNLRNGEILCSAKSRHERPVLNIEYGELKSLINESRAVEVFNLILDTLKLAAEKLTANYSAQNVVGSVASVDGSTLWLEFPPSASLHARQVLQLAGVEGEIPLTQQGQTKTVFYRHLDGWPVRLKRQDQGRWQAERINADASGGSPKIEDKDKPKAKIGDNVFLYGLPDRKGVVPFRQLIRVRNATVAPLVTEVITPEDLRHLTFAVASDEPRLRLLLDEPARAQLRRFDKKKFLVDNAYALPEGQDAEAGKFDSELSPDLFANVSVDNAQVTKLSENLAKKTKQVQLDFKVTFGLYDQDGTEKFKPVTFTLFKTQTMKLEEPDGAPAARLYLNDILAKLVDFYCEKRLTALP